MATIFSNYAFDHSNLDLNRFYENAITFDHSDFDSVLQDNYLGAYNDVTYTDLFVVDWSLNGYDYGSVFGGLNINFNTSLLTITGTVTGYIETVWTGKTYEGIWGIQGVNIDAADIYATATTVSTSDDFAIINAALSEADVFNLSGSGDRAFGYGGNDIMTGYAGNDELDGGNNNDKLYGGNGNDKLYGGNGKDKLYGNNGHDVLNGDKGFDFLNGGKGNDVLNGGKGNDLLQGGKGKDVMLGGTGEDTFVFKNTSESKFKLSKADVIEDFQQGLDVIDLSAIDASTELDGNNAFSFNGTTKFGSGDEGEIYYKQFDNEGTENDYTMVFIDTDDDAGREMSIKLTGLYDLTVDDFIL